MSKSDCIEISAAKFPGEFLGAMIEKIPLLPNLTDLSIKGAFGPNDALILQRVLAAESGLLNLAIDMSTGDAAFELILPGLMFNKGIKKVSLCNLASFRRSRICGIVAAVLKGNCTIERLFVDMFPDDPALDHFEQLALIDPRLHITLDSHEESSDSEEAPFEAEEQAVGE